MLDYIVIKLEITNILYLSNKPCVEKDIYMVDFFEKHASFFKYCNLKFIKTVKKPRSIIINYLHNGIEYNENIGKFINCFNRQMVMEYNRIITINEIINE